MAELTGKEVPIHKRLTPAQRLSLEIGHAFGSYPLGSARKPEDVKWDLVCRINDCLAMCINNFDSDAFMRACGYSNRVNR